MKELQIQQDVRAEKTGLVFTKEIDFKTWKQIGKQLYQIKGSIQFWIGDWLRYGEQKYGEMYEEALQELGYEYGTLANHKYVASNVEISLRNENLTFNHHKEVAKLNTADQKHFLDKSEKENLSTRQLREAIRKENHGDCKHPLENQKSIFISHLVCNDCGYKRRVD
jgi:hypothetical protein